MLTWHASYTCCVTVSLLACDVQVLSRTHMFVWNLPLLLIRNLCKLTAFQCQAAIGVPWPALLSFMCIATVAYMRCTLAYDRQRARIDLLMDTGKFTWYLRQRWLQADITS